MGAAALPDLTMIAVLLLNETQDFQREQGSAARSAAAREGVQLEIAYSTSPIAQIHQILAYIHRPPPSIPTAIVAELTGAAEAFASAARAVLDKGVGWVGLSGSAASLQALREEFPGKLAVSITTDEEAIGHIHARQCRALLPAGGTILYVEGPGLQHEVRARRRGFEEGLQGSVIVIGKTIAADWTEEGAERTASAWLAGPAGRRFLPALVCSQNDSMAIGVRRAALARSARWAGCPFVGCDGLPNQGERLVKEGSLTATVTKPITAGMGVQCATRAAAGSLTSRDIVLAPRPYPCVDVPGRN
jgi:ribose transport system substrate-binding protein